MEMPLPVAHALGMLEAGGHAAYAVGGCVRDRLLHREPNDWDIATDALPEEMMAVFSSARIIPTGLPHGTLTLLFEGMQMEATTFRIDGCYTDCRRPDSVAFTRDIAEDLARRDFTVNAMAYSPCRGFADPFGGREDLQNRRLRCVGRPQERFSEDALRVLRGVRFCAQLGFAAERHTEEAIFTCSLLLQRVSAERLAAEMGRLLCAPQAAEALQRFWPVLQVFLPELPAPNGDACKQALAAIRRLPEGLKRHPMAQRHAPALYWAALLSGTSGLWKVQQSAQHADTALRRLHMDNATREMAVFLIENLPMPVPLGTPAVSRQLSRMGKERFSLLLLLQGAFFAGEPGRLQEIQAAEGQALAQLEKKTPLCVRELALDGRILGTLGIPAGPQMGQLLRELLTRVLDGECENSREALQAEALRLWKG